VPSAEVLARARALLRPSLRPVINATGVVLHTNLGRAPLAEAAVARLVEMARGYCNLEYAVDERARGSRHDHVRELLCQLTGSESAVVVNNCAGAVLLSQGWMTAGGLLILLAGPFDALDGTMARLLGQPTKFGAFVDSVTDRWSEMLIFLGLLYFYLQHGINVEAILVFVAMMGSVMVSYTKARAEALGFDCNVGLLTRMERYLVLGPALVLNVPWLALWIIAVLANVTALQRALYVRRQARERQP
jgi:CDP-diacylglycerol--glycerol-3-phosphate 3-phosphatidyltransferase